MPTRADAPSAAQQEPQDDASSLFELLPIGAYRCSADGRPLRVNLALAHMHGYDAPEAMLAELGTVEPQGWYVDPRRRAEFRRQIEQDGKVRGLVSEIRCQRGGKRLWINECAHLLHDRQGRPCGYEGTVEDITERIQALETLQRSDELLNQLTWHFPGVVFRTRWPMRGAPRIDYISDGVRELYGVEPQAVLRDSALLARMRHPDDRDEVQAGLEASRRTATPHTTQFRIVRPDGSMRWVQGTVGFVARVGEDEVRTGVVLDVTAQREAIALRAERDRAEAAQRASAAMMSRVSHELRTPLNAVLGFAQLLEQAPVIDARHRSWATQIVASGRHLLALVEDVLGLSSATSGELQLQRTAVPLAGVLADCLSMLAGDAAARQITLQRPPDPLPAVIADERRLRQALANLLTNAVNYNRVGGQVTLQVRSDAGWVRIEVTDTGPGLSLAQQARLFQPFERLGAEQGPVAGTGLGLALARELVQAMGGTVSVVSQVGTGSTFCLNLPAARDPCSQCPVVPSG